MTIALGILANDGFIVAADRQETIPGYWKNDVRKLSITAMSSPEEWRCCLVAGAGNAHYIEAFTDSIVDRSRISETPDQTTHRFAKLLQEFYRAHVIPFAGYPSGERPDFQMLTAFSCPSRSRERHDFRLLTSENSVFRSHRRFAAIGSGAMLATSLLGRFATYGNYDVREALLAAIYVMSHVKDSIDGCGKATDIGGMYKGRLVTPGEWQTSELEDHVRAYMNRAEPMCLERIIRTTKPSVSRDALEKCRLEAREALRRVLR